MLTQTDSTTHTEDIHSLYDRYAPMVYRRVLRFYPAAEAPEIVQEVFVRVIERWGSFQGTSSAATWLYRLTTNHCINRLRDQRRRRELWREEGVALWGNSAQDAGHEAHVMLRELFERVEPELLEVGVMYYVDGMSHAEIARVVGCSRPCTASRHKPLCTNTSPTTRGCLGCSAASPKGFGSNVGIGSNT